MTTKNIRAQDYMIISTLDYIVYIYSNYTKWKIIRVLDKTCTTSYSGEFGEKYLKEFKKAWKKGEQSFNALCKKHRFTTKHNHF